MAGTAALAISGMLRVLIPLLPFIGAGAGGFVAAEVYEHKAPWGMSAQIGRLKAAQPGIEAAGEKAGIAKQAASDKAAFAQWSTNLDACRADLKAARDAEAAKITLADKFTSAQAAAAYRLGRASCGGSNATPGPAGHPGAGGVQHDTDFSAAFGSGAAAGPR